MSEIVEKVGQGRDGGVVCADALGATADGICANCTAGPSLRKPGKSRVSFLQGAVDLKNTGKTIVFNAEPRASLAGATACRCTRAGHL